jgi:uncharacterized protein
MSTPAPPGPEDARPVSPLIADPTLAPPSDPERPEGLGGPATPPPPSGDAATETRWKPLGAVLGFFGGFGVAILGALIIGVIAAATGADIKDPPPAVDILSTVWQDLALIGAAVVFATMAGRPKPWQFGLRWPESWPRALGWTALAYLAFLVFSALWIAALGLQNEKDTLPQDLGAKDSDVALYAVAVLVCIIAPFAEEFFFRGFFFRSLANWRGPWLAAIITGVVFGGIHGFGSPAGFLLPLAFLGFVLCVLYWKTRSLIPCIVVHCINNCLAYGSAVDWSSGEVLAAIGVSLAVLGLVLLGIRGVWGPPPAPAVRVWRSPTSAPNG